jgi:diaminopimelate decarboxylase
VAELAAAHGTPLYLYDSGRIREQVRTLRAALARTARPFRIHYAMKANRFGPVLQTLRAEGGVGIDACSPREVAQARAAGFAPSEISVTASMPSNRDLEAFASEGVHVNLDSLSAIRRYAARAPRGTRIGLRLDPGAEVGYGDDPKLTYGNSKFGLPEEIIEAAAATAHAAGLIVDTLHVHCGWGLQRESLPAVRGIFASLARLARRLPGVEVVNVGGGLGARRRAEDAPLSLDAWATAIADEIAPTGVTVACEPGTLLVDQAGLLVVEVNTVEEKAGQVWLGVDAGHNVNVYAAHYGLPIEIVHVARPLAAGDQRYSVAGNINESNDVFGRNVGLPRVEEGDLLALLPAGAYGSSMASDHCLRGWAKEVLL